MRLLVRVLILTSFLATLYMAASVPRAWPAPASHYTIVSIESIALTRLTHAGGVATGSRQVGTQTHAHLLYPDVLDLGTLPEGLSSQANSARTILGEVRAVGYSGTGTLSLLTHAFLYRPGATPPMQDLGTTAGDADSPLFSSCTDLTSAKIVCYGDSPDGQRIVPYYLSGDPLAVTILPTVGTGTSFTVGLNEAGYVIGQDNLHATVWAPDDTRTDLHTTTGTASVALDINDATPPQVVGVTNTDQGQRGFVVTVGSTAMTLIAPLPQDTATRLEAMNDVGDAVGSSQAVPLLLGGPTNQKALFCDTTQSPPACFDLSTRVDNLGGWVLKQALGVSNGGLVAGMGTENGVPKGFVLVPVPDAAPPAPVAPPPHERGPRRPRR